MCSAIGLSRHTVLTNEHEDREKNRFKRYDHCQESKWVSIKRRDGWNPSNICQNPKCKPNGMHRDKCAGTRQASDRVADPVGQ
jgi:hypothetical protein